MSEDKKELFQNVTQGVEHRFTEELRLWLEFIPGMIEFVSKHESKIASKFLRFKNAKGSARKEALGTFNDDYHELRVAAAILKEGAFEVEYEVNSYGPDLRVTNTSDGTHAWIEIKHIRDFPESDWWEFAGQEVAAAVQERLEDLVSPLCCYLAFEDDIDGKGLEQVIDSIDLITDFIVSNHQCWDSLFKIPFEVKVPGVAGVLVDVSRSEKKPAPQISFSYRAKNYIDKGTQERKLRDLVMTAQTVATEPSVVLICTENIAYDYGDVVFWLVRRFQALPDDQNALRPELTGFVYQDNLVPVSRPRSNLVAQNPDADHKLGRDWWELLEKFSFYPQKSR